MNSDARVYFVWAWIFGTVAGPLVIALVFASGLADQPQPHPDRWLAVGICLLLAACAAAVILLRTSETARQRAMSLVALGASLGIGFVELAPLLWG